VSLTSTSKKDGPQQPGRAGRTAQASAAGTSTAGAGTAAQPGLVALVGTGPGNPELLTVRAAGLLGRADLVVGTPELTGQLSHLMPASAEVRDRADLDAEPRLLTRTAQAGKLAVALYSGDPLLFGPAAAQAAACAKARVRFEIVPGLPAATAVPAYAGIPLTAGSSGDVQIIDAADIGQISGDQPQPRSLVILGAEAGPADLAKTLLAAGWPDSTPFTITWNGTTTDQLTVSCQLGSVTSDLKAAGINLLAETGPAVGVVGEAAAAHKDLSWFETKPLFGWRVLVPRTKEQAGSVSQRLRAHGAVPEEVPTIAVEPPRTPQQMERAVKGLVTGRYQWVAFTSANAVRAVREKLEEYGLDARAFAGVKVAAVGDQTGRALLDFGIKPDLVPEGQQSGEGLAAAWQPYDAALDPINRVLLPRADIATEALVARLTELGWEAEDVTAYRTVRAAPPPAPIREAIKGGGFDAVLFTSSSTVRNLIGIAGKPHAVTVIAVIGPQTAQTAAEFGLRVDVRAPKPSATALVDALAEHAAGMREASIAAGEPVRKPSERRRGARRRLR
jgi:uroporphyrinogen III methyltransferase / synthase